MEVGRRVRLSTGETGTIEKIRENILVVIRDEEFFETLSPTMTANKWIVKAERVTLI